MILQTVERVATWLGNATYGVNALLPGVARISPDTQPPNVTIFDARQHGPATRGQFERDATFPVLLVKLFADVAFRPDLEVGGPRDAPEVQILVSYGTRNSDSAAGARDSLYTMVAVEKSLRALWQNGASSDRTQGAVSLIRPVTMRHVDLYAPLGDGFESTGIVVGYYVRDSAP